MNYSYKVKCRKSTTQKMEIVLPGLVDTNPEEAFGLELGKIPKELSKNLAKWLKITPIKNKLDEVDEALVFNVVFEPMKPFKSVIDILVFKKSGGRWKFKISLEATQPDVDDLIIIRSPMNKTTSVSFKLTNISKKRMALFKSFFTPESDSEFTVIPKEGELAKHGQ